MFVRARRGDYDAVLTMYHDQGQIAMKLMGFDRGVTLLGGFPFPICTPAHGTAYDIAGKGIANLGATKAAVLLAASMAQGSGSAQRNLTSGLYREASRVAPDQHCGLRDVPHHLAHDDQRGPVAARGGQRRQ